MLPLPDAAVIVLSQYCAGGFEGFVHQLTTIPMIWL